MAALENEEVQKKGMVFVAYEVGRRLGQSKHFQDLLAHKYLAEDGLPFKLVSVHFCYNSLTIRTAISLIHQVSGRDFRIRFRDHFGSHQECQYELMTFGIPQGFLHIDQHGELRPDLVENYIKIRKKKEMQAKPDNDSAGVVEAASNNDVLLGRGKVSCSYIMSSLFADIKRFSL